MPDSRVIAAERFWPRVNRRGADECWPWQGARRAKSYGEVYAPAVAGARQRYQAHRVAWVLTNGPIPDGMLVCHHCDNPPCCNPAHLFLGEHADNMRDKCAKGRGGYNRGERSGKAKLTREQVAAIRALDLSRYGSGVRAAREFGIARSQLYAIRRGARWPS